MRRASSVSKDDIKDVFGDVALQASLTTKYSLLEIYKVLYIHIYKHGVMTSGVVTRGDNQYTHTHTHGTGRRQRAHHQEVRAEPGG